MRLTVVSEVSLRNEDHEAGSLRAIEILAVLDIDLPVVRNNALALRRHQRAELTGRYDTNKEGP
ncbi:hypothetical protein ACFWWM_33765 [Streptomyces sp. NPDC058682]|uniref:hypothetical protein n=1 Tax=unclassified Streptomyces TaxID=2593676 RepID=UPI00225679CC|nr:hypothetical protein [Streptomyces sp. NBC_01214]MCX4803098.1 hypothetical protein [Streptomyces sp. NBC_01214]